MADFEQLPGELNISVALGDDLAILLDFDVALTGYTFDAQVVKSSGNTAITVVSTNLTEGQITLRLTDSQIAALGVGRYTWFLAWTLSDSSRRVLAGEFTVRERV